MSCIRRQSFTAELNFKIISVAEEIGNRAADRKYDVNEACIQEWRRKKTTLQNANRNRRSFRGPKTGAHPELGAGLAEFIQERRGRGHAVSTKMAQMEALRLAKVHGIPSGQFRASRRWFHRFMKRQGFSIRTRTTLCQRLPDAYEEKLLSFQRYVINLRKQQNYLYSQIGNVDQTPVYFEMPLDTTL